MSSVGDTSVSVHSEFVDAMVLAARNAILSRRFKIAELPRLAEQAVAESSLASLEARFHLVDGRCAVAGQVTAALRVACQRCLQPTELAIEDTFHVVLVQSEEEMNELPDQQDSVITNATHLDLAWLAEEQLLLALPLVPLHAAAQQCSVVGDVQQQAAPSDEKQTPFAQLRELLKK